MLLWTLCLLTISFQLGQSEPTPTPASTMRCYVCSNVEDPRCANDPAQADFIMSCDQFFALKKDTYNTTESTDYFCRKTIETGTTFEGENLPMRVIRSCGNIRNQERSCYRTADAAVKTETCECFDPLCNAGETRASFSSLFNILSLTLTAICFNLF